MKRPLPSLTATEHKILRLIAEGHSSQAVARTLQVSYRTVDWHVNNVLARFGLHKRAVLILLLDREGLL